MNTVNDLRQAFLSFFGANDHEILPSGPLVPRNDPTLMFASAGMVQFKNYFTGAEVPAHPRAVTCQKCVRAGGKHNDLDQVGYTSRHHTFFEMLGNFSFGDYFKDVAIELSWKFLTKELGLDQSKLLVTVYADDDEAASLWRKIAGLSDDKIIRIATSDNFWAMGDSGPCGPCSEIFYDYGHDVAGGPPGSADEDGDRFTEIWNLVFMQFEQVSADKRINLPRPSIDTGMGLERISAVMQGNHDNYGIDLFRSLMAASAEFTGTQIDGLHSVSHRVIADHVRASAFLIADGVLPDREGRGYVLRRIMRRGMRHAHQLGEQREPWLWKMTEALIAGMGQAYPQLLQERDLIETTLRAEEIRFQRTLAKGLKLLNDKSSAIAEGGCLDGETTFNLYDTYGFPADLTQDFLRQRGISVDMAGFEIAMEKQKQEARKSWGGSGDKSEVDETVLLDMADRIGATDFVGYQSTESEAVVVGIVVDGESRDAVSRSETKIFVAFNQTPFYGESGGQVGDTGFIELAGTTRIPVINVTRTRGGLFLHEVDFGAMTHELKTGDVARLVVDREHRSATCAHHSATHLLHEALRQVLGGHVAQRGSLVAPDRLRFDFVHGEPISPEQLLQIEMIANQVVLKNSAVTTSLMPLSEAIDSGARALFGEKYGEIVRVVSMGKSLADSERTYSIELCGGTHVQATGEIGLIKIVEQEAVAAGVRRIEALCGLGLSKWINARESVLTASSGLLSVSVEAVPERISAKLGELSAARRDLKQARIQALMSKVDSAERFGPGGEIGFVGVKVEAVPPTELKPSVDAMRTRLGTGVVALISVDEAQKASLVVGVSKALSSTISAKELAGIGAEILGGRGGGRADIAQSGGANGAAANEALRAISQRVCKLAALVD